MRGRRPLAVVATVMVIAAMLPAGLVGTVAAEPVTYQYDGSPQTARIDVSALDGEFEVEVTTEEGPASGTTILARQTHNAPTIDNGNLLFHNSGAYDTFNVTVTPADGVSGEATFDTGDTWTGRAIGTTGGDRDLICDFGEKLAQMTRPHVPQLDCTPQPGSTDVNTTNSDAEQIQIDLYQSGQNQYSASQNYLTTVENRLEDAKTVARVKGKNAYIRALNNGSSKAAAETAAKQAVSDYYAVQQANLVNQWNADWENAYYIQDVAENESGVPVDFMADFRYDETTGEFQDYHDGLELSPHTRNLVNGTSISVNRWDVNSASDVEAVTIDTGEYYYGADIPGVGVQPPNSNYDRQLIIDYQQYADAWTKFQSQNDVVQADMETLANNTYDAYQAGEINNTDLIDPYVLSSEFSPGDEFQGWAAAQLTLLGSNSPENFDQIGRFNVSVENGSDYTGVLMSQESPPGGAFEVNGTYNPDDITGTQYVVADDDIHELTANFTLTDIRTSDGEKVENVTIVEKQYQTTNVTELKQLYEDLAFERAQIEAREQALGGGGGGWDLSGVNNAALIALAAGAAVLLLKD